MSTNQSSFGRSVARGIGGFILFLVALVVIAGIGFSFWPKIKAAYYDGAKTTNVQPTQAPDNTAALRAQLAAMQAQLNQQRTIVQTVPEGAAPQTLTVVTPVVPSGDGQPAAAPAPAQRIIVLHENDNHGAPIVTGSAACQVAAKGARRCGK